MNYSTPFDLISKECQKHNISIILVGGFAVNYYHVTRQTADIDFLIFIDDYSKIKNILENEEYNEIYKNNLFTRFENKRTNFLDIDFLFIDAKTLKTMIDNGTSIMIGDNSFNIPSLNHLIAMKLHAIKNNPKREYIDLLDILNLITVNTIDINENSFQEILKKYGTLELQNKIKILL